jgi:hypothetical protein
MLLAAVIYLDDGRSLETLRPLKAEKSVICLVEIRRQAVSIIEVIFVLVEVNKKKKIMKHLSYALKRMF